MQNSLSWSTSDRASVPPNSTTIDCEWWQMKCVNACQPIDEQRFLRDHLKVGKKRLDVTLKVSLSISACIYSHSYISRSYISSPNFSSALGQLG